jgi:hypothetical protein
MVVFGTLAGFVLPVMPVLQAAETTANSITGRVVVRETGGAVSDAQVVALRNGLPAKTASTNANGAYQINPVIDGTYELIVRPTTISTTVSPAWVFDATPTSVTLPPSATGVDLLVEAASVTIVGQLVAPSGNDFSGSNRAWVRAENQEGRGNTVLADAQGNFAVKVLPGAILLRFTFENESWIEPTTLRGAVYQGEVGETVDTGSFNVLIKQAQIAGTVNVVRATGAPIAAPAGIPVRAWRLDGAEFAETETKSDGSYQLNVISGTWQIRAVPELNRQYGAPPAYYIPAEAPQVVILRTTTATATQQLAVAVADVTLQGQAVDGTSNANPLPPVNSSDADGRAYALYRDQRGRLSYGPAAPLRDGKFTLRLASTVATTYSVGLYFPPDAPYTALAQAQVRVGTTTSPVSIPVAQDNSSISGTLQQRNGAPQTGVPALISAMSDRGGWARTRVNSLNGTYNLSVVSTDLSGRGGTFWRVRAIVDPVTGYLVQQPRVQRAFLPYNNGEGADVNLNFTVAQPDAIINGRVTRPLPNGQLEPVRGARVVVREQVAEANAAYVREVYTDRFGSYRVRVPASTYRVSVIDVRPQDRPLLNQVLLPPAAQTVTVASSGEVEANLRFRVATAFVNGSVSYNGQPKAALVRARASDGAVTTARASQNGTFTLPLVAGLSWTIEAVSSDQDQFLRSERRNITPVAGQSSLPQPLTLVIAEPIPDTQAFYFDVAEDQTFVMSNGAQVQIPAGAIAATGNAALLVQPLPELAADAGVTPVSFGYRLKIVDGERRLVSRFNTPITLMIPYTDEQLAVLGMSADRLVPSYWDEASSSWKPVEQVSVVPDNNGGGTVQIVVDHFTDYALLGAAGTRTFLPVTIR